jgi:hypothetical protein
MRKIIDKIADKRELKFPNKRWLFKWKIIKINMHFLF